ncbi:MAG TPA: hypothetical protein VHO26_07090 [Propionibacteriaceae bacterium]|nr:hypothetical protein [Propionibacteriaceae bacterium]
MARRGAAPVGGPIPPSPIALRLLARVADLLGAGRRRRPACPRPPETTAPPPAPPPEGPDAGTPGSRDL